MGKYKFWFRWQEFADVLREFSPKHESIDQAEAAAQELGQVKARLEMEKNELDAKLEAERKGLSYSPDCEKAFFVVTFNISYFSSNRFQQH